MRRVPLLQFHGPDGDSPGGALQVRGDDIGRPLVSLPRALRGRDGEKDHKVSENEFRGPPLSPPSRESGSGDAGTGGRAPPPSARRAVPPQVLDNGRGGRGWSCLELQWVVRTGDVLWDKWVKWDGVDRGYAARQNR